MTWLLIGGFFVAMAAAAFLLVTNRATPTGLAQ